MLQQRRAAQLGQVGGRADIGAIQPQKAAGEMQGQRQVAKLGGDGCQVGIVGREVGAELAQQGDAFGAR